MYLPTILRTPLTYAVLSSTFCTVAGQDQIPLRPERCHKNVDPLRIAIIGAGPAGSSAAYYLSKFNNASEYQLPIEIVLFDNNTRVGGRTTTVNALNDSRFPVELGASIFVKVNEILYNATKDFQLPTGLSSSVGTGSDYEFGVWDGQKFAFTAANDNDDDSGSGRWKSWWDIAKLLWKYGLSPIKTRQLVKATVAKFLSLYDQDFPFPDLDTVTSKLGLADLTGIPGNLALRQAGISDQFAHDVIQASTRVNYAQNLGGIHGLETLICMATDGAMAVEGGNWQIFDKLVEKSGATIHLDTQVTSVWTYYHFDRFGIDAKTSSGEPSDYADELQASHSDDSFDYIVLAAPYQFANVKFFPPLTSPPAKVDYVSLHVTLFTSPYLPSPAFFGLEAQDQVPDTILTTLPDDAGIPDTSRGADAVGPTKFWSISTRVLDTSSETDSGGEPSIQYLYKIFSPEPVSATFLSQLFNFDEQNEGPAAELADNTAHNDDKSKSKNKDEMEFRPISTLPKSQITWHHTKIWNSYPYLPPTTKFPPFILAQEPRRDEDDYEDSISSNTSNTNKNNNNNTIPNEVPNYKSSKIFYTSAMEPFISTMETAALAGMNVARMIIDGIEEKFENTPDFVKGCQRDHDGREWHNYHLLSKFLEHESNL